MPLEPQYCTNCSKPIYFVEGKGSKPSGPDWRHTESGAKVCPVTPRAIPAFPGICGQLVDQWGRCDLTPGHQGACEAVYLVEGTMSIEEGDPDSAVEEEPELCGFSTTAVSGRACPCILLKDHAGANDGYHQCRHGAWVGPDA